MAAGVQTISKDGRGLNFTVARGQMILVAMTDEVRGDSPFDMIRNLPKNSILIFRHYTDPNREQLALRVVRACRRAKVRCLIAGDVHLARKCKSDGLHFPEYRLGRLPVRRFMPVHWITTGAAHNLKSVRLIERLGLDAALLSPVYASLSHPGAKTLGTRKFTAICRRTNLPVIALGGISAGHFRRLRHAGAQGVAGISLFSKHRKQRGL